MEWAKTHVTRAAFLELHVAAHDLDYVGTLQQFLDEGLGNGHGAILTDRSSRAGLVAASAQRFAPSLRRTIAPGKQNQEST